MISIIVPVYNTENYLRECIDSILAQTYKNIEVILVDDGSTDNSFLICKEYEKKDSRIKAFHKENAGVSSARNYGISCATGEYISFCDSDDKISPNLYQLLMEYMERFNVDRVISGYKYFYNDGHILYCKPRIKDGKYEANYILNRMIDDGTLSGFLFSGVNNSIFKMSIINENNIKFDPEIKYNEDSFFSFQYMIFSKNIYSIQSKATYYYRQHKTSATKKREVGDKYEILRRKLYSMNLQDMNINFETQMMRRNVTETLWQILDISEKMYYRDAIKSIKELLRKKEIQLGLSEIMSDDLNLYKHFYYILIKLKLARTLYFTSSKVVPFLSKYISR